jgi:hypothetical protein
MSLICETTYQALKIEVTILFGERRRGGRDTAELAWQADISDLPSYNLCSASSVIQQWNTSLEAYFC